MTKGLVTCRTKESPGFFLPGFLMARPCNASFRDSNGITGARPHTIDDILTGILPNAPWKGEAPRPMKTGSDVPNGHAWPVALLPLPQPQPLATAFLPPASVRLTILFLKYFY